ncbi:hypothetical protein LSH36_127g19007 [Paralvinella palmiformis]|uniref:Pre-rRNA-processing protein Ipi1 N-terminal domain-containing protein n=1 Tax=Paralvinella palmiformis TaxID=53620 RepID=A0AAD9N8A0_9ANNE|nr:hypothetical protein LSH36_127g19007 [Paralvinella palmiformis]
MPKSRKKKVKHQDFAKVKLKVGKKLPRAANETDASFRSRSIQIKDQFRSSSEGDQSLLINKKKINIKDILSQCQHYNPGNKYDALKRLHEAVSTSPNILDDNLAMILERCSELFLDKDPIIRSTVRKTLCVIFARISSNHITPFFPIISAYLCCAMTHLNEEIQLDSLKILDIALQYYPDLVITSSSQLLPNLLEQISRLQTTGGKKEVNSRVLAANPSGITGSTRWRIDVLKRLKRVLETVLSVKQDGPMSVIKTSGVDEIKWQCIKSHMKLCQYPAWYSHSYIVQSPGVTASSGVDVLASGQSLKAYLQSLIPLLLQCWVEVGPAQLISSLPGHSGGAVVRVLHCKPPVMTHFFDANSRKERWFEKIVIFMTTQLQHQKLSTEELELGVSVYGQLLRILSDEKTRTNLLTAALHIYRSKHAKSAELEIMFTFFANNFFSDGNKEMRSLEVFRSWQHSFPTLLTSISGKNDTIITLILTTIKSGLIHREETFNADILDNCKLLGGTKGDVIIDDHQLSHISQLGLRINHSKDDTDMWLKQHTRLQCILGELQSLTLPESVVGQIWINLVTQTLLGAQSISLLQAAAILLTTSMLVVSMDVSSDFVILMTQLILSSVALIADSLRGRIVRADVCNTLISSDLDTAALQGSLWCIRTSRGLWCCILDKISDRNRRRNSLIRDQVLLHKEKLVNLMDCLLIKYPQMESNELFGSITYYLSVEVK